MKQTFRGAVLIKNPIVQCQYALYGGLVARTVSFDTVSLHLLTFRILEPYPSKDIGLDLSHVISH